MSRSSLPDADQSTPWVPGRVAAQAAATPDATAVCYRDTQLSYRELAERAETLAGVLTSAGVAPDTVVGVYLERGVELVVALLAVLKAGAGYAVLDPELPVDRLRGMLSDAGSAVVVGRTGAPIERLGTGLRPVYMDAAAAIAPAGGPRPWPVPPGAADRVACVMFTSGSTGRPKGTVASHRAICGTLTGDALASFGPGSVWLQCSPVSWDLFALELWGPLMHGGTSVLHPGQRPDPVVIAQLVAAHGITGMYLSGSLFNVVVDEYPAALAGVRELIVGGEAISGVHAARAARAGPQLRLTNGYGPVEAMVFLTAHRIGPADLGGASVPIGRPLPDKRVYVLDDQLRPVPDGEVGELYGAGIGLARCYAGQPGLTAERFLADPYGPPGTRMYRTGDLGRRRGDGVLEYLGRTDTQVKLRGYRVELGEIEAVLAGHPELERAAVAVEPDGTGDQRLVAYVVAAGGPAQAPTVAALRAHAAATLPDFMLPDRVVALPALPLTATGKLDRAALRPAAGDHRPEPAAQRLAELFAEVLGVAAVSPEDDFFALGGDSLAALRLAVRIRELAGPDAFGGDAGALAVAVRMIFASPTAGRLATRLGIEKLPPATGREPAPRPPWLPPEQGRVWYLERLAAGDVSAYQLPVLIRLHGQVDPTALAAAVADLVDRHEALRTRFVDHLGGPRAQPAQMPTRIELEQVRAPAAGLAEWVAGAVRRRLDPAAGRLLHATLVTVEDQPHSHALLLMLHRIAAGDRSLPLLLADLSRAYTARQAGTAPDWPEPAAGHAAAAAAGYDRLGRPSDPDSLAARQLRFWRRELRDPPRSATLPTRPGAPDVAGPAVAAVRRELDPAGYERVAALARTHRTTVATVTHAALVAVVARAGGAGAGAAPATEVMIGLLASGPDLAGVVGPDPGLLVRRTPVRDDPTGAELLSRVRDADLDALAHREVPFEWVLAALNPPRSPGRLPYTELVLTAPPRTGLRSDLVAGVEWPLPPAARFPVLVEVIEDDTGLSLTVTYATDRYDRPVAEWLVEALLRTLDAMATGPNSRLSLVDLPSAPYRWPAARPVPTAGPADPELMRRIATIWAEVLGVDRVGEDDDFFALGGNSLRAVRAAARLSAAEGRQVPATAILASPTVAGLARALAGAAEPPERLAPIPRRPRVPVVTADPA